MLKFKSTLFYIFCSCHCFQSFGQNIYTTDKWQARDRWQKVPEIMEAMGIKSGDVVADIGSHQGYMTVKFSNQVGSRGKVYAVDVNQSHLRKLDNLLKDQGISNVETILGDYDDPKLFPKSIDHAFIMDAYHEMDDHMDILQHVKKALKPGGKLIILEPIHKDRRDLTRSKQENKHEIDIKYVIGDLKKAGYRVLKQKDPFIHRGQSKNDVLWLLIAQPI